MGATLALVIRSWTDPRRCRMADEIVLIMILNLVFALTGIFDRLSGLPIACEAHFGGYRAEPVA